MNLLIRWCHGLLLFLPLICAHAPVQVRIPLSSAVSLLLEVTEVMVGTQSSLSSCCCGGVVIISDGDLLVFFSFQLALVEAQRPLEDVFDLVGLDKQQRHRNEQRV